MFTTEQIIKVLTENENNLSHLKRFLSEYEGKIPYQSYALEVYPRTSVEWMLGPGIECKAINGVLLKIKKKLSESTAESSKTNNNTNEEEALSA